jgi:hypothetical protein
VGFGTPPEYSRQNFSDVGAKGPGGHLQVPTLPLALCHIPRQVGACLMVAGAEGKRLQAASASSLLRAACLASASPPGLCAFEFSKLWRARTCSLLCIPVVGSYRSDGHSGD